ncbi:MAG TPA: winged helix-turn-helix transcriptional regulator [Sphingomicrobium sp.]
MSEFTITPELVRRLSAGRWLMPILAAMADSGGSRFSVLERQLKVSKSVLSATLARLEAAGWVCRNPGHGHPLRPEYLLTGEGRGVAGWCEKVIAQRRALGLEPGAFGRWSLPLIGEIGGGWRRFSALQRGLAPISPRALSLELASLSDAALVDRRAPGPLYGLTGRGVRFAANVSLPG